MVRLLSPRDHLVTGRKDNEGLPLSAARARLKRAVRLQDKPGEIVKTPEFIAGLSAAGISNRAIERATGVRRADLDAKTQPYELSIMAVRERLKVHKIQAMERIEQKLYPRLEREMDQGDAKDIDALARSAMNLEKIQSQVSGEGQKVTVENRGEPTVDLKVLIQNLINDPAQQT